jgi:hypothetical protein
MSASSLLPWFLPPDGVTMGRADHRDVVLVAGTDPDAYKGTVDVMAPHVRPDGQGRLPALSPGPPAPQRRSPSARGRAPS